MYILLYTRIVFVYYVYVCYLLCLYLALGLVFLSTLPSIKTTFGCVFSHLSFAFNTNLDHYMYSVALVFDILCCFLFYAYSNHGNSIIFDDSVFFF